jgi:hypothetical protein
MAETIVNALATMNLHGNRENSGMLRAFQSILFLSSFVTSENEHENTAATEQSHHDKVTAERAKRSTLDDFISQYSSMMLIGESNGLFVISISEDLLDEGNLVMFILQERRNQSLLWQSRYDANSSLFDLNRLFRSLRNHNS